MKVLYKGKEYKRNDYINRVCHFKIEGGQIEMPLFDNELTKEEILNIYLENKKKNTFLYIILPFIVFLFLFLLINTLVLIYWNYLNRNISVFLIALSVLYLFFVINKLIKIIRKDVCYLSKTPRGTRYNMVSKEVDKSIVGFLRGEWYEKNGYNINANCS